MLFIEVIRCNRQFFIIKQAFVDFLQDFCPYTNGKYIVRRNWAKKYYLVIAAIKFATEFFIKWFLKTIDE